MLCGCWAVIIEALSAPRSAGFAPMTGRSKVVCRLNVRGSPAPVVEEVSDDRRADSYEKREHALMMMSRGLLGVGRRQGRSARRASLRPMRAAMMSSAIRNWGTEMTPSCRSRTNVRCSPRIIRQIRLESPLVP